MISTVCVCTWAIKTDRGRERGRGKGQNFFHPCSRQHALRLPSTREDNAHLTASCYLPPINLEIPRAAQYKQHSADLHGPRQSASLAHGWWLCLGAWPPGFAQLCLSLSLSHQRVCLLVMGEPEQGSTSFPPGVPGCPSTGLLSSGKCPDVFILSAPAQGLV